MGQSSERLSRNFSVIAAGTVGGWCCAFIILTFGNIIGRSGNSDANYVGYWDPSSTAGLALMYGVPLGVILFSFSYAKFLRKVSLKTAIRASFLGTLGGGLLGALGSPPIAVMTGSLGFIFASAYVAERSETKYHDDPATK